MCRVTSNTCTSVGLVEKNQQLLNQTLEFDRVKREMEMRQKTHRIIYLHDNKTFKMINRKPEIRFRVVRDSTRKVMRSKIMKEYKKNEFQK